MNSSAVWVISGPSGVGKGTVCARLRELHPEAYFSVSATTRTPRAGEVHGESYHFLTEEQFAQLIEDEALLEWALVHGTHHYGTLKGPVLEAVAEGRQVVLEIDLQGARQIKQNLPQAQLVFLAPPSWDELVARLEGRGTEDAGTRARRLATAQTEMAAASEADHIVVNTEIEETVTALVSLMGL